MVKINTRMIGNRLQKMEIISVARMIGLQESYSHQKESLFPEDEEEKGGEASPVGLISYFKNGKTCPPFQ